MTISIQGSHILKKGRQTGTWDVNAFQEADRDVSVDVGHPLFGSDVPGITLQATVDVAGRVNPYPRRKAGSDVAFFMTSDGFREVLAAMYRADREATLAAMAEAILGSGVPSDAEVKNAD